MIALPPLFATARSCCCSEERLPGKTMRLSRRMPYAMYCRKQALNSTTSCSYCILRQTLYQIQRLIGNLSCLCTKRAHQFSFVCAGMDQRKAVHEKKCCVTNSKPAIKNPGAVPRTSPVARRQCLLSQPVQRCGHPSPSTAWVNGNHHHWSWYG